MQLSPRVCQTELVATRAGRAQPRGPGAAVAGCPAARLLGVESLV